MSNFRAKPIEKVPLNQHVVDAIIEAIRCHDLNLGDKLPSEEQLCQEFRVGRHVVREGLRRLQEMSIVRTETGRGTFVCSQVPETLETQLSGLVLLGNVTDENLFDFRMAIESYAAYFSARAGNTQELDVMQDCLKRMEKTKDSRAKEGQFLDANFEFHQALVRMSGNQMYIVLYNTITDLLKSNLRRAPYSEESCNRSYEEHRAIYEAIVAGDAEAAFQQERVHLVRLREARGYPF